jgi:hypothetical protein
LAILFLSLNGLKAIADVSQFHANFAKLHQRHIILRAEFQRLRQEMTDFEKLEALVEALAPLEDNWVAWKKAAEICRQVASTVLQEDLDTEMSH